MLESRSSLFHFEGLEVKEILNKEKNEHLRTIRLVLLCLIDSEIWRVKGRVKKERVEANCEISRLHQHLLLQNPLHV